MYALYTNKQSLTANSYFTQQHTPYSDQTLYTVLTLLVLLYVLHNAITCAHTHTIAGAAFYC
jgi:hypothetical protein